MPRLTLQFGRKRSSGGYAAVFTDGTEVTAEGVGPTQRGRGGREELMAGRRRPPNLVKLHRKAKDALAQALAPGELPRVVVYGLGDAAIVGTDRSAYVFKSGVKAGLPFSHRLKSFEYERIMRVDVRRGRGVDVVVIHAPLKMAVCASYWADDRDDPWKARNAIPVARLESGLEDAAAQLGALIAGFNEHRLRPAEPVASSPESPAPQVLEGLHELEHKRSIRPVVVPGRRRGGAPGSGRTQ